MARNSSFNALTRKTLRRARRIKIGKNGKFSIPIIIVPQQVSTHMLVSSVFTLASFSPYQKKVLKELRKVRKRIKKLIAEGYTFSGEIDEIFNAEEITFSKKTLHLLQKMKMDYLRKHAASYKGETDINKIIAMHNAEVAAKRKATREAKRRQNQPPVPDGKEEDIPDESEVLRSGIVRDEERYIARVLQFIGATDEDRINYALERAQSVLNMINSATDDEIRAIIDFVENNGTVMNIVDAAQREFDGIFYDAPKYNNDLLGVTPFGGENLFEYIFGDDTDMLPSSFYDFRNEVEDEDY